MEGEEATTTRPLGTTIINREAHFPRMSGGWNKRYRNHCLSRRRMTRTGVFIAFLVFSPIILPLFCLCFPFICAIAVLLHLVPIKWRFQWGDGDRDKAGTIVRCKEVAGPAEARTGLLERYLEDQLGLVVDACFGSMN